MDVRTYRALQGAIEKWRKIVIGTGVDNGVDNCPLCAEFYDNSCKGCPVMRLTGQSFCRGTPYREFADYREKGKAVNVAGIRAAFAMLEFLQRLLPSRKLKGV